MTLRELIGLVLAFAVSNAFLSWLTPWASSNPTLFGIWNGLLACYLGFAFFQSWMQSVLRWTRTGEGDPPDRHRRWTALGVAEATVIGGTMLVCVPPLLTSGGRVHDVTAPIAILFIGSVAGILALRRLRVGPDGSLTGRRGGPTIGGGANTGRGETF